jgi:hypothetical protein
MISALRQVSATVKRANLFPALFSKRDGRARPSPSNTSQKHYKPSSMNACHSPSWKQVTSKSQQ